MPLIRSKKETHIKITYKKFKLKNKLSGRNFSTRMCESEMLTTSHFSFSEELKIFLFSNSSALVLHNCTDLFISFILYLWPPVSFSGPVTQIISVYWTKIVISSDRSTCQLLARGWRGRLVRSIALHRQHPNILYPFQNVHSNWSYECMPNRMILKKLKHCLPLPRWT